MVCCSLLLVWAGCESSDSDAPTPPATENHASAPDSAITTDTATTSTPTGERSLDERLYDLSLAAEVKKALARDRELRAYNFEPTVERGTVLLKGDVSTRDEHERAAEVVASLQSVEAVTNSVTVVGQPVLAEAGENRRTGSGSTHVVQSGETLWGIARSHQSSIDNIRQHNNLTDGRLQPGQEIEIPSP